MERKMERAWAVKSRPHLILIGVVRNVRDLRRLSAALGDSESPRELHLASHLTLLPLLQLADGACNQPVVA